MASQTHQYYREPLEQESEVQYLLEPLMNPSPPPCVNTATTESTKTLIITYVKCTRPVIQNGPMCGLVALTMASDLLSNINNTSNGENDPMSLSETCKQHPERVLEYAKQTGFTKQGEMFSVEYMKEIAKHHLLLNAKTIDFELLVQRSLLEVLACDTCAILIPYDADKNHTPCQAKGHKAHWCVLVGFALTLTINNLEEGHKTSIAPDSMQLLKFCSTDTKIQGHFIVKEEFKQRFVSMLNSINTKADGRFSQVKVDRLHVFARHGKSRRLGLWDIEALRRSNANLFEVDPQRTLPGDYVIPDAGGIKKGLCCKALIVSSTSL